MLINSLALENNPDVILHFCYCQQIPWKDQNPNQFCLWVVSLFDPTEDVTLENQAFFQKGWIFY